MRELIHYGTLHHSPLPPREETPQVRIAIEAYESLLRGVFTYLAEELVQEHKRNPLHRVYMEGVYNIPSLGDVDHAVTLPARALISQGVALEPTEHEGIAYLNYVLEGRVVELQDKIKKVRVADFLDYLEDQEYRLTLDSFFEGVEYADIHAARELWISRRIRLSLKEGERGVLFLGKLHNQRNIQRFLSPGTHYRYRDLFPDFPSDL